MGTQLKTADILGGLAEEEAKPDEVKEQPHIEKVEKKPKTSNDFAVRKAAAEKAAVGKASPYEADLRAKLRDKVQMNMGQIPRFIADSFSAQAKKAGMGQREYFYHLLREQGAEIPPYSEMDGRKL